MRCDHGPAGEVPAFASPPPPPAPPSGRASKLSLPHAATTTSSPHGAARTPSFYGRLRRRLDGRAGLDRSLGRAGAAAAEDREQEQSGAARAGIRQEDIILEVDGIPIEDAGDIQGLMTAELIDKEITVQVFRGGDIVSLRPVPVELDD